MEVSYKFDTTGLQDKLRRLAPKVSEKKLATGRAAQIVKSGIRNELAEDVKVSGSGVDDNRGPIKNAIITKPNQKGDTWVGYNDSAYYWRFVEDGHWVMDNREGRTTKEDENGNQRTIRNYRYRLGTLNTGGWSFSGYHFTEHAVEKVEPKVKARMRQEYIKIIRSHK